MERKVIFQIEDFQEIPEWTKDYPEHKFSVFKCCFLSTAPNSHHLEIDDKTLRKYADTILGGFLVADIRGGDATTHTDSEVIFGVFPKEQKIEFVEEDGVTKAYAYAVVSKLYGENFNEIFGDKNLRNSSVEMSVVVENGADEGRVESFDIYGLTRLGVTVNGSCPDADIAMVRFAEDEATAFFNEGSILADLEKFVADKRKKLAEKYVSHPVNTSKDAIYQGEWDGQKAKEDLIKEKNYKSLAKKVCLKLEEGWENREITKLGYPVMGLYDGEWRYSAKGLASAQAYAEKENETEVLAKIKAIKKKLSLDNPDGKEETKMAEEIKNESAVEEVNTEPEKVDVEMAEPAPETEAKEPETVAESESENENPEEKVKVEVEVTEEKEDFEAKCAQLSKDIEERDNIIMQKDTHIAECEKELAELREYKRCMEAAQLACKVEEALAEIKGFATDSQIDAFREEGKKCTFENIDAFVNKIKATCFDATKSKIEGINNADMFKFSIPVKENKSTSVWDRL